MAEEGNESERIRSLAGQLGISSTALQQGDIERLADPSYSLSMSNEELERLKNAGGAKGGPIGYREGGAEPLAHTTAATSEAPRALGQPAAPSDFHARQTAHRSTAEDEEDEDQELGHETGEEESEEVSFSDFSASLTDTGARRGRKYGIGGFLDGVHGEGGDPWGESAHGHDEEDDSASVSLSLPDSFYDNTDDSLLNVAASPRHGNAVPCRLSACNATHANQTHR